ncbi:hypothetical protein AN958_12097 [Leucoagaricus sp. SymC.cos]|nr:hypothetical protein AN958_12097 [Leucoagaricus sp. SymC.cos]
MNLHEGDETRGVPTLIPTSPDDRLLGSNQNDSYPTPSCRSIASFNSITSRCQSVQ